MNITLLRQPLGSVQAQWLVLGVFEDESEPPADVAGHGLWKESSRRLTAEKDVTGSLGELTPFYDVAGFRRRACCWSDSAREAGLTPGRPSRPDSPFPSGWRASAGRASPSRCRRRASRCRGVGPDRGAIVATRGPGLRKSEANRHAFATLSLVDRARDRGRRRAVRAVIAVREDRRRGRQPARGTWSILLRATSRRRGWPTGSRSIASDAGITVEVWKEERIRRERFGGLLGVAAGSDEPPRFMILEYRQRG